MIPRYFTFLEGSGASARAGVRMREAVSLSKTAAIRSKFGAAERFDGKGL
jgi:hypothetical protein